MRENIENHLGMSHCWVISLRFDSPVTGVATFQAKTIFAKNEARTRGKMDFLAKNEKPDVCPVWSEGRELNPRPSPWEGDILPLNYPR